MALAAASMPAVSVMVMPERISASGMLGVSTVARGSSCSFRAATASSEISRSPEVATITGSTTRFLAPYSFSLAAITWISGMLDTMPVFTASGKMSVNTQSSSSARNSGVHSTMSLTPVVFWATRAVTAQVANTPLAVMVLMSAWMPAPPLGSVPAIVNAVFISMLPFLALKFYQAAEGGAPDPPPEAAKGPLVLRSYGFQSPRSRTYQSASARRAA